MPNKTMNYQLNQWEATDEFLRTDFNEDNAKIEAALDTKAEIVTGTYAGDGEATRIIELGFQPKALLVCADNGRMGDTTGQSYYYGGLVLPGHPILAGNITALAITDTGFQVSVDTATSWVYTNLNGMVYHYIAFK